MITPEETLDTELQSRLAAVRERRLAAFEKTSLAWLALVPGWTERLAVACDFPTGDAPLLEFLSRLEQARLCSTQPAVTDEGISFWVDESVRETMLDELRRQHGATFLQQMSADIGNRVLAQIKNVPVPPAVVRWATLAGQAGGDLAKAANWLNHEIGALLDSGQTSEALAWVDTSTRLAEVLGGVLDSAVLTGRRKLELAYRRAQDERHLADLLERKEQIEAFKRLLKGPDGMWALHFVGMGGVGKTMLLRYITARFAPEIQAPTTRVDFDHLSPDYPVRRPGQLLNELAVELRSYATDSAIESRFEDFQDRILELHEVLSGQPPPPDPLANIHHPLFDKALRGFSDLLKLLPAPVVLILDTCEELAKAPLVGAMMPNVEATLEILERIHSLVPSIRVVFAGRRLLAQSGNGWKASDSLLPQGRGYLPKFKDYLGLHQIRGFDRKEATIFLERLAGLEPPSPMFDAVLKQSVETGTTVGVDSDDSARSESGERYNPFDLALFGDWVRRDPRITSAEISSGETDPYVDMRIVQRIRQPGVLAALPAVILLRRFDETMLRPVLKDRSSTEVFRELGEQEWVDYQVDDSTGSGFLEVERNLYHRFLKYYHHPTRRVLLEEAKRRLGPGLIELARTRAMRDLNIAHLDAALRLAPIDESALLWEDVARRIPEEADWNWALGTTGRILDLHGAVNSAEHPLYGAVRAIQISALIHQFPDVQVSEAWTEVLKSAHQHPLRIVGKWLRLRASLQLARYGSEPLESLGPDIARFYEGEIKGRDEAAGACYMEQLAGSAAAALESILEAEETDPLNRRPRRPVPELWPEDLAHGELSAEIRSFAAMLSARRLLLGDEWASAAEKVEEALNLTESRAAETTQRWADWFAPQHLRDRVRLEALRLQEKLGGAFEQQLLIEWQREAAGHLRSIDSERLVSKILERRLAEGPVSAEELESLLKSDRYDPDRQPLRVAHRSAPPLFASVALGFLATGNAEVALKIIEQRLTESTASSRDESSVRACEQAESVLIRRMRMRDRAMRFAVRIRRSNNPEALTLVRPLAALCGLPGSDAAWLAAPDNNASPRMVHEWWQCQEALWIARAEETTRILRELGPDAIESAKKLEDPSLQLSLELDLQEGCLISERIGKQVSKTDLTGSAAAAMVPPRGTGREVREDIFRSMLRTSVLLQSGVSYSEWLRSLPDNGSYFQLHLERLGRRRAAEIALEEGELLGLRLPARAAILLERASEWFKESEDRQGAFVSSVAALTGAVRGRQIEPEAARQLIAEKIRPGYEALAAEGADLPRWEEIANPSDLSPLDHPVWGGWIERLEHCLARTEATATELAAALETRLASRYATGIPAELKLLEVPRETESRSTRDRIRALIHGVVRVLSVSIDLFLLIAWGWFLLRGSHTTLGQIATSAGLLFAGGAVLAAVLVAKDRVADSTKLPLRVTYMWTVTGGVVGFGVIVLGYWFTGWLVRLVEPGGVRWFWQLLLYGGFLIAISAIVGTVKQFSRLVVKAIEAARGALSELTLSITMPKESASPRVDPSITVPVVVRRLLKLPVLRFSPFPKLVKEESAPLETGASTPELRDYRSAAEAIPTALQEEMNARVSKLWMFSLPVRLDVEPPLAGFPWEAFLAEGIDARKAADQRARPSERLRFWRSGPPFPDSTSIQARWKSRAVNVVTSRTWELMVEKGWKGFTDEVLVGKSSPGGSCSILHVIGTPVQTSSGLQLQLGDQGTRSGRESLERQSKSPAPSRAKQLIRVETLPADKAWLVLLQAEPVLTVRRLESEREQAFYLRMSAADLFAAGANAVLMLPALSPDLAEEALILIASHMPKASPPGLKQLLRTVSTLRRLISKPTGDRLVPGEDGEPAATSALNLRELSLDVTLFAREGRKSAGAIAPPQEETHHV